MSQKDLNPERLKAFSDGVFAVIITVLVLDLRPPREATWGALLAEWPTAVSYAVSYLFVTIVWVNHHYILGFADSATGRLIWVNAAHLFTVSLLPFSTAWIADTQLAAGIPVCVYATVFFLVNLTYIALCFELVDRPVTKALLPRMRSRMRLRATATLIVFALAAIVALWHPLVGFGLACCCLVTYLRPQVPGH
ncbi:MAG TPA: TMEM175 family protein [Casimicrobiaceae bacterium]|nr:TMEM175 family protein [Casimicrobiaceae bacterium]